MKTLQISIFSVCVLVFYSLQTSQAQNASKFKAKIEYTFVESGPTIYDSVFAATLTIEEKDFSALSNFYYSRGGKLQSINLKRKLQSNKKIKKTNKGYQIELGTFTPANPLGEIYFEDSLGKRKKADLY